MSEYQDRDLSRWAGLSFKTSSGEPMSDARFYPAKTICVYCGEYKDPALDVCWDPDLRCKGDQ